MDQSLELKGSVGSPSAANFPNDVRTVKKMLNLISPVLRIIGSRGIYSEQTLDPHSDINLNKAIFYFQKHFCAFKRPDGIITPNGPTHLALVREFQKLNPMRNKLFGLALISDRQAQYSSIQTLQMLPAFFLHKMLFLKQITPHESLFAKLHPVSIYQRLSQYTQKIKGKIDHWGGDVFKLFEQGLSNKRTDPKKLAKEQKPKAKTLYAPPPQQNVHSGVPQNPLNNDGSIRSKLLSQWHEDWADEKYGNSSVKTFQSSGCPVTCLAMLILAYGLNTEETGEDPLELNDFLKSHGGFVANGASLKFSIAFKLLGLIVAPSCSKEYKGCLSPKINEQNIDDCIKSGNLILIRVWRSKIKGKNAQLPTRNSLNDIDDGHWLIITGKTATGVYTVIDPDGGVLSHFVWLRFPDYCLLAGTRHDVIATQHLFNVVTSQNVQEEYAKLNIKTGSLKYYVVNRMYPFANFNNKIMS